MSTLLWISEPEPGVPGQGDSEAVGAGYEYRLCCTRTKMFSFFDISETEPFVPEQQYTKSCLCFESIKMTSLLYYNIGNQRAS
jgi:hypothetical protein